MKTEILHTLKRVTQKLVIAAGLTFTLLANVFGQCQNVPANAISIPNTPTGIYRITTSGTYVIPFGYTVNATSSNVPNYTIYNFGTLGPIYGNTTGVTLNNCGIKNGSAGLTTGFTFNNYGVLNAATTYSATGGTLNIFPGSVLNGTSLNLSGGTINVSNGAILNLTNLTLNGGTLTTNGTINTTNLYINSINANLTGNGTVVVKTDFRNYGTISGNLTFPNGYPNPNYGTISPSVQFYSCTNVNKIGAWVNKTTLTNNGGARVSPAIFSYSGRVYATLGTETAYPFNQKYDLNFYDVATNAWEQRTWQTSGASAVTVASGVVGSKAYIVTYDNTKSPIVLSTWELDLITNVWTLKNTSTSQTVLNNVGPGASSFVLGGKLYLFGGYFQNMVAVNGFVVYDPTINIWSAKANLPDPYVQGNTVAFATSTNGYIVVNDPGSGQVSVYQYNATLNTWTKKANVPTDISYNFNLAAKGVGICEYGFMVLAAYTATGNENQVWRYNATADTWSQAAKFTGASRNMGYSLTTLNGKIYLFGGSNYPTFFNDLWVFDPASGTALAREEDVEEEPADANSNTTNTINSILIAPNPATNRAQVFYNLGNQANGVLKVYNVQGMATVLQQELSGAQGSVELNTENWSSGVYICTVQAGDAVVSKERLVISK